MSRTSYSDVPGILKILVIGVISLLVYWPYHYFTREPPGGRTWRVECGAHIHGVRQLEPGLEWKKRAEAGQKTAQYLYGLYFYRIGEKDASAGPLPDTTRNPNYQQAIRWFSKAFNQKDDDSGVYLTMMYAKGLGVDADTRKAYHYALHTLKNHQTTDYGAFPCDFIFLVQNLASSLPPDRRTAIEKEEDFVPTVALAIRKPLQLIQN